MNEGFKFTAQICMARWPSLKQNAMHYYLLCKLISLIEYLRLRAQKLTEIFRKPKDELAVNLGSINWVIRNQTKYQLIQLDKGKQNIFVHQRKRGEKRECMISNCWLPFLREIRVFSGMFCHMVDSGGPWAALWRLAEAEAGRATFLGPSGKTI